MNGTDSEITEAPAQHFNALLWLLLIFAIGWLIWEVTRSPAWAAMAMCLKFGLEDFRTSWWLLRSDPDRRRGRACCWLYIASGLWQIAIIGVAMVILTVVLVQALQAQQGNAAPVFQLVMGAIIAIFLGFVFSTLATYVAMFHAWRNDIRPWLNGAVHIARRKNEWPPLYGHSNRVMTLMITTIIMTCVILVPVLLFAVTSAFHDDFGPKNVRTIRQGGIVLSVFLLLPGLAILIRNLKRQRFFAAHPADCWGDEPMRVLSALRTEETERGNSGDRY